LEHPLHLANFIISEMELILGEWEAFARTIKPASSKMDTTELRDHAELMLKFIAKDLNTAQTRVEQRTKSHGLAARNIGDSGEEHGLNRLESKFTMEQLFSEYRALRSSVLRLWKDAHPSPEISDFEDMIRFNEAVDQLIASSVFSFTDAQRQAEETEGRRRTQFLAMLGHELRNPLSPIITASSLLKMAKGNEKVIDSASDVIARQVTHMAGLIDDLLEISRVTRGQIEVKLDDVEIEQVFIDAVEQVMPQIEARGHRFEMQVLPRPTVVRCDKKRLVQVIANLLRNAVKYTPNGGQVQLKSVLHEDEVVITIEDNGIGMPAEFISHAFELFAQVESTSDRADGGLGLGLALVRTLVQLHGGKVACFSEGPGKGSQFTVWLPRQQDNGTLKSKLS
jgi:signal transduction histidine kinase